MLKKNLPALAIIKHTVFTWKCSHTHKHTHKHFINVRQLLRCHCNPKMFYGMNEWMNEYVCVSLGCIKNFLNSFVICCLKAQNEIFLHFANSALSLVEFVHSSLRTKSALQRNVIQFQQLRFDEPLSRFRVYQITVYCVFWKKGNMTLKTGYDLIILLIIFSFNAPT